MHWLTRLVLCSSIWISSIIIFSLSYLTVYLHHIPPRYHSIPVYFDYSRQPVQAQMTFPPVFSIILTVAIESRPKVLSFVGTDSARQES